METGSLPLMLCDVDERRLEPVAAVLRSAGVQVMVLAGADGRRCGNKRSNWDSPSSMRQAVPLALRSSASTSCQEIP